MLIKARKLTVMAMLAAVSIVLVYFIHFPLFPAAAFLEYDPADIPIIIGTFAFGVPGGLLITLVASVIQGITVSAGSGLYGILMHFVATGSYVLAAGLIYRRWKTRKGALVAMIVGTVTMGIVMMGANLMITPHFTGWPVEEVKTLLLPVILPFNLIKAGINSAVTFLIYKPISRMIHSFNEKGASAEKKLPKC